MTEYVERDAALNVNFRVNVNSFERRITTAKRAVQTYADEIAKLPAADVRPVVRGKNIGKDYAAVDQFVCSECGIELQGWARVERDEDTWNVTYHEYLFNYCPNCGAQVEGQR